VDVFFAEVGVAVGVFSCAKADTANDTTTTFTARLDMIRILTGFIMVSVAISDPMSLCLRRSIGWK
jgi:hypothetical protein